MPRYLVELYMSRMGAGCLPQAGARARAGAEALAREGTPVRYVRSFFVPKDETWFLIYEGPSSAAVEAAANAGGIPFERVAELITKP